MFVVKVIVQSDRQWSWPLWGAKLKLCVSPVTLKSATEFIIMNTANIKISLFFYNKIIED